MCAQTGRAKNFSINKQRPPAPPTRLKMSAARAVAIVVEHFGFGNCKSCFTRAEQMCPDPWLHMAAGVCHFCEAMRDIRVEFPATAIARVRAACKTAAAQRKPDDVQERAQTARVLEEQFDLSC